MRTSRTIGAAILVMAATVPLQAQSQRSRPTQHTLQSRSISSLPSYQRDPNSVEVEFDSRATGQSPARSDPRPANRHDTLASKARDRLADEGIQESEKYVVTSTGGKIAVFGRTDDQRQKEKVGEFLREIEGVDEVENHILVSKNEDSKSDAELVKGVQRQLYWSWFVDDKKLNVEAKDGVVTLSGSVEDWSELNNAIKNAFDGGAQRVVNKMVLDQPSQTSLLERLARQPQDNRTSERRGSQDQQRGYYADWYPEDEHGYGTQDAYGAQRRRSPRFSRSSGYRYASERGQGDRGSDVPQNSYFRTRTEDPRASAMQWQRAQEIEVAVQEGLQKRLQGSQIFADYKDGTLRLYGFARDNRQKQQAERLIRQLRGVRAGQSFIEVRSGQRLQQNY